MQQATTATFTCGRFALKFDRPLVMGVVNLTADSFSDGGLYADSSAAIARAERLITDGADIIDLGAESTRPGASPINPNVELAQLKPVILALRGANVPLSVDTRHASTMRAVIDLGADMINDVNGFRDPLAIQAVTQSSMLGLCVMHMRGEPLTMQQCPIYRDVVAEVAEFFYRQKQCLQEAGINETRMLFDPGIGFGKSFEHNQALIRGLSQLRLGLKGSGLLLGVSRKSLIGVITGKPVNQRLIGSVTAAVACIAQGANVVRVHDVAETIDAIKVWQQLGVTRASD